jgi:two-component system NarL family sensor kinase
LELFILLQVSSEQDVKEIVVLTTIAFLVTPIFLIFYIISYNRYKRANVKEKERMKLAFEAEMLKSHIEVQEHTMQTIAAELHDNIGQLLGLTSFTLGAVATHPQAQEQDKIETAKELSLKATTELRQLAKLMQGEQLLTMGLDVAIKTELDWLIRNGRIAVTYKNTLKSFILGGTDIELVLFRVFQESINNVIKHAKASKIEVELTESEHDIKLSIADDGIGFSSEKINQHPKGLGLKSFEKRTKMLGGTCEVLSELSKGTTVIIKIPK